MMHLRQDSFSLHHQGLLVVDVAPEPSFAVIFASARGESSEHETISPFEEQESLVHEPGTITHLFKVGLIPAIKKNFFTSLNMTSKKGPYTQPERSLFGGKSSSYQSNSGHSAENTKNKGGFYYHYSRCTFLFITEKE